MNRYRRSMLPALLALCLLALFGCRPQVPEGQGQAETASPAPAPAPAPSPAETGTTSDPWTSDLATSDLPTATSPAAGLPTDRPLRAAFLVVDGVYNTELAAPYDVFQHTKFHAKPGIEPFTVSPTGEPVTTFEGIRIAPAYGFQNAPAAIDLLVVPSAAGSMDKDLENPALIDWVRRVGGQARHVISLCDGAFVLAQAGLLNGVPATTFPDDYKRFAQRFPTVDLRINVSFVDAGKVLTSQGGARSYDVALYLVDRLYGPQAARGVGHGLLIPWPPAPGTLKYQTTVSTPAPGDP